MNRHNSAFGALNAFARRQYTALILTLVFGGATCLASEVKGITKPQNDIFLSFSVSGKVERCFFKEGQTVKKGDVVAALETVPEKIRLKQLEMEASSTTDIRAGELECKQKQAELKRVEETHKKGATSDSELENARLAADVAALKVETAKHQTQIAKLRQEELVAELQRRLLVAPIDGVIQIMEVDPGETVEALTPVVRILAIDQLWIDLMVPLKKLPLITKLSALKVRFPPYGNEAAGEVVEGKIEFISPLADSASETVKIRLGIRNPQKWPVGTTVEVILPDE